MIAKLFSQMLRYGCTRLEIGVQSVYEVCCRQVIESVCADSYLGRSSGYEPRPYRPSR